jgi:hypothetical protein
LRCECGGASRVLETRHKGREILRRRICDKCGQRWATYEARTARGLTSSVMLQQNQALRREIGRLRDLDRKRKKRIKAAMAKGRRTAWAKKRRVITDWCPPEWIPVYKKMAASATYRPAANAKLMVLEFIEKGYPPDYVKFRKSPTQSSKRSDDPKGSSPHTSP